MEHDQAIRAFLAIDLPHEIRNEIAQIQNRLKNDLRGLIRWVRPEGIHLTLKFFGDIKGNDMETVSRVMENQAGRINPLRFGIKNLGVFPDLKRPRVLWLGIDGDVESLIAFQKAMDRELYAHGFPIEDRPFRPHLTLARIREPKGLMGIAKLMENRDGYTAGCFDAAEIILFRSQLMPQGAVYTKLACFPFGG